MGNGNRGGGRKALRSKFSKSGGGFWADSLSDKIEPTPLWQSVRSKRFRRLLTILKKAPEVERVIVEGSSSHNNDYMRRPKPHLKGKVVKVIQLLCLAGMAKEVPAVARLMESNTCAR